MCERLVVHIAVRHSQKYDDRTPLRCGVAPQIGAKRKGYLRRTQLSGQPGRNGADNLTSRDGTASRGKVVCSLAAADQGHRAAQAQLAADRPVAGHEPLPESTHPAAIGSSRRREW